MAQSKKNPAWADCCEDWGGYMAAKKAKLEEQFQEAAKNQYSSPSTLFSGIAIFVNGYTNPTADELKRLMMAHGGIYHHYLRPQGTTHLIASNLPYTKIVAYRKAKNPLPLCKPEWITDSIKAGKVLDFRNYLLYSQCTTNQPAIFAQFSKKAEPQLESRTIMPECSKSSVASSIEKISQAVSNHKSPEKNIQTISNLDSATANSTKNPKFLTEFYNNSRLHHISTMGAMFKDYINDLRDKNNGEFPGLNALKKKFRHCQPGPSNKVHDSDSDDDLFNDHMSTKNTEKPSLSRNNKIIMHIDMDCFFVSVGLRKHPELRGFPIAVAHAKGNKQNGSNDPDECSSMSEVASCSYEARKAGVKNGMFLGQALKLCPNLKTIKYDFEGYTEVSYILYDTVASYTLDIEAVSCDEMYADCSKILETAGISPLEFANVIRNEIKEKTGCPVSTGFGENKLQARLATKKAKPDGQYHLKGNDVNYFIRTLNVRDLPGVGYSTSQKLHQMNIKTCADLEKISLYVLQKEFGKKNGQQLHDMCRGIDPSKLNLEHVRKSVSAEVNYGIRFENTDAAHEFLKKLSSEVSDRLKKNSMKGRCITLKVLFRAKDAPIEPKKFMGCGACDAFNKSKNLIAATDDSVIITRETISLWNQFNEKPEEARGIGIQITKLESTKNKPTGSTILKFIDKMKEQDRIVSESNNVTEENFNSKPETVLEKQIFCLEDEQKPSSSSENEVLSEEIQFDCDDVNTVDILSKKDNVINSEISDKLKGKNSKNPVSERLKNPSQLKQTTQQEFFKETKRNSFYKQGKTKLPDIQEIDMKVLIELPEDIRNEILNEYAKNQESSGSLANRAIGIPENLINNFSNSTNNKQVHAEKDISFSQIDPEFLAALPNEMKDEVKMYCNAKRKEKNVQPEEGPRPAAPTGSGWNMFKGFDKKPQKNLKTKPGKQRGGKSGGKKDLKSVPSSSKITREIENQTKDTCENKNQNFEENVQSQLCKDIPGLNNSIYFDRSQGDPEHSEILSNLVKCLLDLPISQVKIQIQQWISNNSDVNDVDFLSMATYLGTLPRKRRIDELFVLLKCLNRCIGEKESCIWHDTYKKIIKHVQIRMLSEYNHEIMIPEQICCDKCNINT